MVETNTRSMADKEDVVESKERKDRRSMALSHMRHAIQDRSKPGDIGKYWYHYNLNLSALRKSARYLIVSVSGFTKLTEAMDKKGPSGLQIMCQILNSYFKDLVSVVTDHGGDIIKFAGDAVIVVWRPETLGLKPVVTATPKYATRDRNRTCILMLSLDYRGTDEGAKASKKSRSYHFRSLSTSVRGKSRDSMGSRTSRRGGSDTPDYHSQNERTIRHSKVSKNSSQTDKSEDYFIDNNADILRQLSMAAIRCAIDMLSRLSDFRATEGVLLDLHLGLGCGQLTQMILGNPSQHLEHVVSGGPIQEMSHAVTLANTKELVVSPAVWELISDSVLKADLKNIRIVNNHEERQPIKLEKPYRALKSLFHFAPSSIILENPVSFTMTPKTTKQKSKRRKNNSISKNLQRGVRETQIQNSPEFRIRNTSSGIKRQQSKGNSNDSESTPKTNERVGKSGRYGSSTKTKDITHLRNSHGPFQAYERGLHSFAAAFPEDTEKANIGCWFLSSDKKHRLLHYNYSLTKNDTKQRWSVQERRQDGSWIELFAASKTNGTQYAAPPPRMFIPSQDLRLSLNLMNSQALQPIKRANSAHLVIQCHSRYGDEAIYDLGRNTVRGINDRAKKYRRKKILPTLRMFLPQHVINCLQANTCRRADRIDYRFSSMRSVTIMFINSTGISLSNNAANEQHTLEKAQLLMTATQDCISNWEGTVNKLLVDDKGVVVLAVFGLPPYRHPDDAARAVLAGLSMKMIFKTYGFSCSIGIVSGRVFCGMVGGESRREYTTIGDAVNLSARYMTQGWKISGGKDSSVVTCDENTCRMAGNWVEFKRQEDCVCKGKTAKQKIFTAERVLQSLTNKLSLDEHYTFSSGNYKRFLPHQLNPAEEIFREKLNGARMQSPKSNDSETKRHERFKSISDVQDIRSLRWPEKRKLSVTGGYGIGKTTMKQYLTNTAKKRGCTVCCSEPFDLGLSTTHLTTNRSGMSDRLLSWKSVLRQLLKVVHRFSKKIGPLNRKLLANGKEWIDFKSSLSEKLLDKSTPIENAKSAMSTPVYSLSRLHDSGTRSTSIQTMDRQAHRYASTIAGVASLASLAISKKKMAPMLLILDNCELFDDISWDLVGRLLLIKGIILCLIMRPDWQVESELQTLSASIPFFSLKLEPLVYRDAIRLIQSLLQIPMDQKREFKALICHWNAQNLDLSNSCHQMSKALTALNNMKLEEGIVFKNKTTGKSGTRKGSTFETLTALSMPPVMEDLLILKMDNLTCLQQDIVKVLSVVESPITLTDIAHGLGVKTKTKKELRTLMGWLQESCLDLLSYEVLGVQFESHHAVIRNSKDTNAFMEKQHHRRNISRRQTKEQYIHGGRNTVKDRNEMHMGTREIVPSLRAVSGNYTKVRGHFNPSWSQSRSKKQFSGRQRSAAIHDRHQLAKKSAPSSTKSAISRHSSLTATTASFRARVDAIKRDRENSKTEKRLSQLKESVRRSFRQEQKKEMKSDSPPKKQKGFTLNQRDVDAICRNDSKEASQIIHAQSQDIESTADVSASDKIATHTDSNLLGGVCLNEEKSNDKNEKNEADDNEDDDTQQADRREAPNKCWYSTMIVDRSQRDKINDSALPQEPEFETIMFKGGVLEFSGNDLNHFKFEKSPTNRELKEASKVENTKSSQGVEYSHIKPKDKQGDKKKLPVRGHLFKR
eukprot:jgi/Bigna1/68358/fgenesh1_pg.6_\